MAEALETDGKAAGGICSLEGISKRYGALEVLSGVTLSFPESSISAVLGPSGCGKTTLLNIIAGIDTEFAGSRSGFDGRSFSYAFQEERLLPWMSAIDNVMFALRPWYEEADRKAHARSALDAVDLGSSLRMLPSQLSGGMRRRVSIARAFAVPADMLLMDEPFVSVDLKTRIGLMDAFLSLHAADTRTVVLVTHDVREAVYVGDRIHTLSGKPSRVLDSLEPGLSRKERAYESASSAGIVARLYESVLS